MDPSMTKSERILAAVEAYNNDPERSLRELSGIYHINRQTLANHIKGKSKTAVDYGVTKQRLTPAGEMVVAETIQLAYRQAFPLTIASIHEMANEILRGKGSSDPIGVNWHIGFLNRHLELRSAVSRPIDKQRVMSEDPNVFIYFFHLFEQTRAEYGISDSDTYNMDESGCAIGIEQASKVIIPANEKETFTKQDSKREWATLIECISAGGDKAPLFAILAGKTHLVDNWSNLKASDACLAVSDNGWTNNELGLKWLKHFNT
jgi:hypothetical protein